MHGRQLTSQGQNCLIFGPHYDRKVLKHTHTHTLSNPSGLLRSAFALRSDFSSGLTENLMVTNVIFNANGV